MLFWVDNPALLLRDWSKSPPPSLVERHPDEHSGDDGGDEDERGYDHDAGQAGRDE